MNTEEKIEWEIEDVPLTCNYCGYEDPEYRWGNPGRVLDECVNKLCPKCKKPLLTQEDVDKIKAQLSCIEFANIQNNEQN